MDRDDDVDDDSTATTTRDDDDDDDADDRRRLGRRRRRTTTTRDDVDEPGSELDELPTPARSPNRRTRARRRRGRLALTRARWTSPASSATRPPSVSDDQPPVAVDRRRPRPRRPSQRTRRPEQRVARAHGVEHVALGRRPSQRSSDAEQPLEHRLDRLGLEPQRAGASRAAPAGSPRSRSATLRPIPSTAQPSCGRPSTRIPATLRPSTRTSLGHFSRAPPAPDHLGHGHAGGERQQPRRVADHHASTAAPGPAARLQVRPWRPRPAVCSRGGHERAVRALRARPARARGRWSSR